jgi:hypothetical protein
MFVYCIWWEERPIPEMLRKFSEYVGLQAVQQSLNDERSSHFEGTLFSLQLLMII